MGLQTAVVDETISSVMTTHLPTGVVIGAIIREGQLQVPRGNKIIQTGDRVIAFADAEVVTEISEKI